MKNYEGMFIIKPDMAKDELDKTLKVLQDTITKGGGKVANCQPWGRRKLAYVVKKHVEGEYYLCDFEAEPKNILSMENAYRLNEDILRVLITVKET